MNIYRKAITTVIVYLPIAIAVAVISDVITENKAIKILIQLMMAGIMLYHVVKLINNAD